MTLPSPALRTALFVFLVLPWAGADSGHGQESAPGSPLVPRNDAILTDGSGSLAGSMPFATQAPPGARVPPRPLRHRDDRRPIPTNDWWSSLCWEPLSSAMFAHPLVLKAEPGGLRIHTPSEPTVFGRGWITPMPGTGGDLVVGLAGATFEEARAADYDDIFVTAEFVDGDAVLRTRFGHGSPYVFCSFQGGGLTVALPPGNRPFPAASSDNVRVVVSGGRHYGLYASAGARWEGPDPAGRMALVGTREGRITIAALPDTRPDTLALFERHAHAHVSRARVSWEYVPSVNTIRTTFSLEFDGPPDAPAATLLALYPHQWRAAQGDWLPFTYPSVRGPMKVLVGHGFTTERPFPGLLPELPPLPGNPADAGLLAASFNRREPTTGDTYWLGKRLGKWSTLLPLAEQAGDHGLADELMGRIRGVLDDFLDPSPEGGSFWFDPDWGTLVGHPASFGSDDQLNDHHFHYGYFLRAAAALAARDPAWLARRRDAVELLARDIASPDREDPWFPFLRCFDPYAGHSWASGHARFHDGNNNESSSEALNAWAGLVLWGEVAGNREWRDLGLWLFATELAAVEAYWFDVDASLRPPGFDRPAVAMIWGGKSVAETWFGADVELVHGINWLPITPTSLYLGRHREWCRTTFDATLAERPDGSFRHWADVLWMFRALSDPADARRRFEARETDFSPEAGAPLAFTDRWISTMQTLGLPTKAVRALDSPYFAVFEKQNRLTRVVWNPTESQRPTRFSDGTTVTAPPGISIHPPGEPAHRSR